MPRKRFFPFAALVAFAPLYCLVVTGFGQERLPVPHFRGTRLPVPPAQEQAWKSPRADVPETLVSAAAALFEEDLPDPRGCEYREIQIAVGSVWSNSGNILQTHGWMMPAVGDDKQRFAIAWNGLIYSVVFMGDKADLDSDIRSLLKSDAQRRGASTRFGVRDIIHAWSESESASLESLLPLKACFLLRLGKGQLAQEYWTAWAAGLSTNTNDNERNKRDPYLMLATDWVWASFDRAVCAHKRGDHQLSLLDCAALVSMNKAVETEARKRNFERRTDDRKELPYLGFLGPLPSLLADEQRRVNTPLPKQAPEKRDQQACIAWLIGDLEHVDAGQLSQPGGVDVSWDARVAKLVAEGEPAIELLLKCVVEDERLTQSVQFGRDFHYGREIIFVHEAAYQAVRRILKEATLTELTYRPSELYGSVEDRERLVSTVREKWNTLKKTSLQDRLFAALADSELDSADWVQAAESLTQRPELSGGNLKKGDKTPMRGEVLRAKAEPSLTKLMIERIHQLESAGSSAQLRAAFRIAGCLHDWDPQGATATLAELFAAGKTHLTTAANADAIQTLGWSMANLTKLRQVAGDATALDEYADWIRDFEPGKGGSGAWYDFLPPLWENPDHPAIAAAAETMFNNEKSPWSQQFFRGSHYVVSSPILGVPGFRKRLLVELANKAAAGKVDVDAKGNARIEVTDVLSTGADPMERTFDPLAPTAAGEVSFRICDSYAWSLSNLEGMPRCELYWPEAERDKAVAACAAFLVKYGDNFKFSSRTQPLEELWRGVAPAARLNFAALDHPATAADVAKGLAIFSQVGSGEVRAVKGQTLPTEAKWSAFKSYPFTKAYVDPVTGKSGQRTEFKNEGVVWQCEEVLVEGRWQRYYGFVGPHTMAKVAGEEIEFPAMVSK